MAEQPVATSTKPKHLRTFVIIAVGLVVMVSCITIVVVVVVTGALPAATDMLNLTIVCMDQNLNMTFDQCDAWVKGLIEDDMSSFNECRSIADKDTRAIYDCLDQQNLSPNDLE